MNMIKMRWRRFQKLLGRFTLLLVEGFSETVLFRQLRDYVFGLRNFGNRKHMTVIFFFSKYLKFKLDFKNVGKNWEKVFCFWYHCIWIGIVKLSLLRTGYFLSAANVLTKSSKIFYVNKRNFFQLNWLGRDQWIWERFCNAEFNSASASALCCLSKGPLKRDLLDIHLITFPESVYSEIQKLWGSSFFSKCLKFNLYFKNAAKNWEKVFFCLR